MPATLIIKDGGDIHGIWDEVIDLTRLGKLTIERLTRIDFVEAEQMWEVTEVDNPIALFQSKSREACIAWEAENATVLIERKLKEKEKPVWVCLNEECPDQSHTTFPRETFDENGADPRCPKCGQSLSLK